MQLSYFPDILNGNTILSEEESKHLIRVLRKTEGDKFHVVDGNGGLYLVEIIVASPKKCEIQILSKQLNYGKRNNRIHIAIAPTKNLDRFEWFLEKVTEIGIDEITPLLCDHSERKVIKPERLEKIIISAMKQSNQAYLPKLNEIKKLNNFVEEQHNNSSLKLIAHCEDGDRSLIKNYSDLSDVTILIGPEGDFSNSEIKLATANKFKPISLGNTRLRTETAGILACHSIQLLNN